MLTAPITFSELDIAIHRTRWGRYTLPQWEALSDDEKFEELAYDHYRQKKVKQMIDPFWARIDEEKPISDVGAFYALMLQSI